PRRAGARARERSKSTSRRPPELLPRTACSGRIASIRRRTLRRRVHRYWEEPWRLFESNRRAHDKPIAGDLSVAGAALAVQPRLEHQDGPEVMLPFPAAEMLAPFRAHRLGAEIPVRAQPALVEQRLRPVAQRAAQPVIDGDAEALFPALEQ